MLMSQVCKVAVWFKSLVQIKHRISDNYYHIKPSHNIMSCAARWPPQYAPAPADPVTLTFDLEVGVGVACDLGYRCAKFRLPRPFGFRVRADVRDIRRTPMTALCPPPLRGGGIITTMYT